MRVVIDINMFVSSFFGGYPRKVIDLWKTGQISLCLSSDVIAEYVITGDRAVLAVGRYLNIKMVTPRRFFENYTAR